MANKYYTNRYSFWSDNKSNIVKIDKSFDSYGFFEKNYFSNDLGVVKFFNLIRDRFSFPGDLTEVYQKFACDLVNNQTYCKTQSSGGGGGGNTGGGSGNTGGGSGNVRNRYRNCDKESKYTKGCKTSPDGDIGKVQACLGGLVQDGKFWNKTEAALKNAGYPNGFTKKDIDVICKTNTSGDSGNQNSQSQVTPVVLPEWATCLKNLKKVSVSRDYDNVEIVRMPFDPNDKGYFWPTKEFLYLYKSGKEIRGSWSCDNSRLIIKTEDGQMWSKTNGWEPLVRRNNNNNNNINYQDDYTTYDDNEDNYE